MGSRIRAGARVLRRRAPSVLGGPAHSLTRETGWYGGGPVRAESSFLGRSSFLWVARGLAGGPRGAPAIFVNGRAAWSQWVLISTGLLRSILAGAVLLVWLRGSDPRTVVAIARRSGIMHHPWCTQTGAHPCAPQPHNYLHPHLQTKKAHKKRQQETAKMGAPDDYTSCEIHSPPAPKTQTQLHKSEIDATTRLPQLRPGHAPGAGRQPRGRRLRGGARARGSGASPSVARANGPSARKRLRGVAFHGARLAPPAPSPWRPSVSRPRPLRFPDPDPNYSPLSVNNLLVSCG